MGNLYIVATPIGNLQDITLRALDILKEVDYIVCEDTRRTGNLINLLIGKGNVKGQYFSYFEHNEKRKVPEVVSFLEQGKDVALVSDSGTPLISDPGFKLVRECVLRKIKVIPIPGPSSVISALIISGLPTDKFTFLGFLPKGIGKRTKLLSSLKRSLLEIPSTVIIFESPYKISRTLGEVKSVFGDIKVVICREITKIHEESVAGKISEVLKNKIKGEIVLMFNLKES